MRLHEHELELHELDLVVGRLTRQVLLPLLLRQPLLPICLPQLQALLGPKFDPHATSAKVE